MKQPAHSVDPHFAAGVSSSTLYNDDLAPTGPAQRTWKWYHFAALWVGMVMNIASYMLAAGLTEHGILQVFDVLDVGNTPILVLPYIDGCDLNKILSQRRLMRDDPDQER